jgi:ethanolaminephosphotransferase
MGSFNAPNEGQIALIIGMICTGIYGQKIWLSNVPGLNISVRALMSGGMLFLTLVTIGTSFHRIITKAKKDRIKTLKHHIIIDTLLNWITMLPLCIGILSWLFFGSQETLKDCQLSFLFTFGVSYAHITADLVLAHMLNQPVKFMLLPQLPAVIGGLNAFVRYYWPDRALWAASSESLAVNIAFVAALAQYLHFAIGVVGQLSRFLNIYCFSLKKRDAEKSM